MVDNSSVFFARSNSDLSEKIMLDPRMANRHGFICGATGTGKTVTLKVLAESFSELGVPVFLSDVKGDLSGFIVPGTAGDQINERIRKLGIEDSFHFSSYPTAFFDVLGQKGIPLRTTVSEMGPLLLGQCLGLNQTQTDVLTVIFKIADDNGLLLCDTKDLKSMLAFAGEDTSRFELEYGHISKATLSAIVRSVVALEAEGGEHFFGEPAIDISDFFSKDEKGFGYINILECETLINKPKLYTAFMLFLLSEIYETLPEVGDQDRPRMVFFFDEAHLMFGNAAPALMEKIGQVIKLIRSKGVGIYFVTQSPADIPDSVMPQLSNKIEHALRAYTPKERKAVKAAAESFRENPAFDTAELIQNLGTGEAVVSMLGPDGIPQIARHVCILPPKSHMGTVTDAARKNSFLMHPLADKYMEETDPESAYELLEKRRLKMDEDNKRAAKEAERTRALEKEQERARKEAEKERERAGKAAAREQEKARREAEKKLADQEKALKRSVKSVASSTSGTIGREIGKALGSSVGGSFGRTLGGNVGASIGRNIIGTLFK